MSDTTAPPEDGEGGATRPFADVLRRLNRGITHTELSTAMQDLIAAVQDTGKAGSITIQLKVNPVKGNDSMVTIVDGFKVAAPSRDRATSVFYIDDEHNLRDQDPRQMTIPGVVAVVDAPARPQPIGKAN